MKFWKPKLLFIDDLHRFAEQQNFEYLFEICRKNKINLIATCRSEIEYNKTKKRMLDKNLDLETEIFDQIIEVNEISEQQGKEIADNADRHWNEIKFNKTVGSIFMPLAEMDRRFKECTSEEKSVLKAVKKLYICGVYDEDQIFQLDKIQKVSETEGIKKEKYQWEELIEKLCEKEFTKIKEKDIYRIWAEGAYLEDIVKLNHSELSVFEELLSIFAEISQELFKIGNRAYEIGSVKLQKASYMKVAIKAYQEALKIITVEQFPMDYAMTQNNIGNAYRTLAEVEEKALNCKKAIEAYQEALKIFTENSYPEYNKIVAGNIEKLTNFCKMNEIKL